MDLNLASGGVLDLVAHDLDVFEQHHGLKGTVLKSLHGVLHSEADHTGVKSDVLEELSNDLSLLNVLDVGECLASKGDSLTETLIETVGNINSGNNLLLESEIEMITSLHDEFEIGATSNNDTLDVGHVIGDEVLASKLTALDDVQMTLFFSKTSETHSGLSTSTVLLGQLDGHSVDDLLVHTLEGGEHDTGTINDDEAEFFVVLKEYEERFSVETVLALVGKLVDGSEGRKVDLDFLLSLAILHEDNTTEDAKTILGGVFVELEHLTGGGDSRNDGLARLSRLDRFGT